jgi:transcriptional regulator
MHNCLRVEITETEALAASSAGQDVVDLLKGTLEILILTTVNRGKMHGYAISRWIRETTREVLSVEEGALYPALRRMEKRGLLKSAWGQTDTGREAKFYELTAAGRRQLDAQRADWEQYVEAMSRVLE